MFLKQPILGFGAGRKSVVLNNEANAYDTVGRTTYNFTSQAFGAAHPDRQIIAAFFGQNVVRTHNSCTIGGITAAADINTADSGTTVSIWRAAVPTGTSGTCSLTLSGVANFQACAVWSLNFASSTIFDTSTAINDDPSTTINIAAGGAVLAFVGATTSASAPSSWVGVTQDFTQFQDSNHGYSGASDNFRSQLTSRTISVSTNNTPGQVVLGVCSYKP